GPGDIVKEVMRFGPPTPIEVGVSGLAFTGEDKVEHFAYVEKVREELGKIPSLRDLQFAQSLDYPAVSVEVDRQRAGLSGLTTGDVSRSLVAATSSSRFTVPIFWADPKTGIGYQVQVEIPPYQMNSAEEIGLVPIPGGKGDSPPEERGQSPFPPGKWPKSLLIRDVADIKEDKIPGEYDRYNMRRLLSLTANIEGEDLGRVSVRIAKALRAAGD